MQKSKFQNAIAGLAHHRFWNSQRRLISCQLFINFYVRMCIQGHIKLIFSLQNQKSQYQSQCLRLMLVSVSVLSQVKLKLKLELKLELSLAKTKLFSDIDQRGG